MKPDFHELMREKYPNGLTGVFAIGGTRTTYILEQNRDADDPGEIVDFDEHSTYLMSRYRDFIRMYLELGGGHLIVTVFSFLGFHNRGPDYARFATENMKQLMLPEQVAFYKEMNIDPYFAGIDTLLLDPPESPVHQLGVELTAFQNNWDYQEGRHKLVWEIASLPLFSFWKIFSEMDSEQHAEIQASIQGLPDFEAVYKALYPHYSQMVYGTQLPMPAFYLGTNKSGDLKWRSPMPISLSGGDFLRLFYTPYPTLFTRRETLKRIMEEVVYGKRFFSDQKDYSGRYTRELAQQEYERVMELSKDVNTTLGLARRVRIDDD